MNIQNAIEVSPRSARAQASAAWVALYGKWQKRLLSWAEAAGRIWATYWLLLIGGFFVVGSVVLKWVEFPFSRNLPGLELPLLHEIGLMPHISPISFGVVGLLVFAGGLYFSRFNLVSLGVAAAVLLTLFALVPAHLAFAQPEMLQRLTDEDRAMPLVNAFSRDFMPQNLGAAEIIPKRLLLYSGWGRLVGAWSFLRLGWYCFGLGSFLVGIHALGQIHRQRGSVILALFGLPLAALAIVTTPAMLGQYSFTRGSLAKAEGRNAEAISYYRTAMRWDAWHAQDIGLYATIGELQRQAGLAEGSPERRIDRALILLNANRYEQAIFELESAAKAGGPLGQTARSEAARVRTSFGLALYQAGGIGSAVTLWQQAMAEDPLLVYCLPYLARGYFDIGRYESAIQAADEMSKIVKDHNSSLGNAYSLAADSYAKLGRDSEARKYYNLSLTADPIVNYWALTGLVGE